MTNYFSFKGFLSLHRSVALQKEERKREEQRRAITKTMKWELNIQVPCASCTIVRLSLMWLLTFHVQIYYTVITALFFADVSNHYYIFVGISSI